MSNFERVLVALIAALLVGEAILSASTPKKPTKPRPQQSRLERRVLLLEHDVRELRRDLRAELRREPDCRD